MAKEEIVEKINEYLSNGGLVNPELMDHITTQTC